MLVSLIALCCAAPPNVVFLSVDTLRADRLGCYGYQNPTSPHIDALAENALCFEDCLCEVPLTFPSFGAMLTARYPRLTGATRNGLRMPDAVPRVPEIFRNAGFQTFCVQSNWTLKAKLSGLDKGFDTYEDNFNEKRWGFVNPERYADEVTGIALELLAKRDPKRPFFAWIHYSDPHGPYRFHKDFAPSGKPRFWQANEKKAARKYDSEVAFADHHIGRLLEALPKENTYILFVADHGESLYEHGYLGHGRRIYQQCIHIPLMLQGPGIAPGWSPAPARGVDIGPTLLGLAKLTPAPGMLGVDLRATPPDLGRIRVIETYGGAVPKLPGAKALMASKPAQYQGVILEGWKLLVEENGLQELYCLKEDPQELKNVILEEGPRAAALEKHIATWNETIEQGAATEVDLSKDDLDALKSLGYLE